MNEKEKTQQLGRYLERTLNTWAQQGAEKAEELGFPASKVVAALLTTLARQLAKTGLGVGISKDDLLTGVGMSYQHVKDDFGDALEALGSCSSVDELEAKLESLGIKLDDDAKNALEKLKAHEADCKDRGESSGFSVKVHKDEDVPASRTLH